MVDSRGSMTYFNTWQRPILPLILKDQLAISSDPAGVRTRCRRTAGIPRARSWTTAEASVAASNLELPHMMDLVRIEHFLISVFPLRLYHVWT
jgi:hypothetical protein